MISSQYEHLLIIAQDTVRKTMLALASMDNGLSSHKYTNELPREMKSEVDYRLEEIIFEQLKPTGISILSEESITPIEANNIGLRWVVDPLDGTVNFIRGLAPCSISVALWLGDDPVFGVIGEYPTCKLAWGGRSFGAFIEDSPIHVSEIQEKIQAVLCTGFPSRFDFSSEAMTAYSESASMYAKVRMLGAASLSLLQVARGSADAYTEQDIMIWDIAAGLAIVEGAGGSISLLPGRYKYSHNVYASNNLI